MRTGQRDRIWLTGGALGAVVLLAIGWFFLIGPQNSQTSKLQGEADAAQLSLSTLQHRLAELRRQNGDLPKYRAQLALERQALPQTSGMPAFLRELHEVADGRGVAVSGFTVGAATAVAGTATPVFSMPLNLTVIGTSTTLTRFLDQVQQVQPRAVLITNATITATEQGGAPTGAITLTLTLRVYVAPSIGASTPSPAPTS